ncbi:uncharacterized protein LOC117173458 isoform X3 [Belonocnema kinseyi]|uniref:uncharacterized protein LOC117173458 isoform X3 n=1 Tax=Belonocnema kinseyi TaxID=2817044 RepID=UPI00143CCA57|nr:uncharacterized protein LOC117173458 isoform X3 [Belonocnema kinseyi]
MLKKYEDFFEEFGSLSLWFLHRKGGDKFAYGRSSCLIGYNKLERRRLFEERKWKFNEAFCEYYHKKLILANQVPVDDEEVVDYILDGMPDLQLRTQARMRCLKTSSELLEGFNKSSLQLQLTKVLFQESRCEY